MRYIYSILLIIFLLIPAYHLSANNIEEAVGISIGENTFCTKSIIEYKNEYFVIGAGHSVDVCDDLVLMPNGNILIIDLISSGDSIKLPKIVRRDWAVYKIIDIKGNKPITSINLSFDYKINSNVKVLLSQDISSEERHCSNGFIYKGEIFLDMCTVAGDSGAPYINSVNQLVAVHSAKTKDNSYSIGSIINDTMKDVLECYLNNKSDYKYCNINETNNIVLGYKNISKLSIKNQEG